MDGGGSDDLPLAVDIDMQWEDGKEAAVPCLLPNPGINVQWGDGMGRKREDDFTVSEISNGNHHGRVGRGVLANARPGFRRFMPEGGFVLPRPDGSILQFHTSDRWPPVSTGGSVVV
jgi:hypothetical protein